MAAGTTGPRTGRVPGTAEGVPATGGGAWRTRGTDRQGTRGTVAAGDGADADADVGACVKAGTGQRISGRARDTSPAKRMAAVM